MEVETFPNSPSVRPSFHDGYLDGVRLQKDKSVELYCRTVSGKEYELAARDLVQLRVIDFTEGNIIFDLLLCEARKARRSLIAKVFRFDEARQASAVDRALERANQSSWRLLEVQTSTECEVLLLFAGSLTITPDVDVR
jgi:hypothetical protein